MLDKKLKQIDKRYNLVYSNKTGRFYLYVSYGLNKQKEMDFGVVLPKDLIDVVRRTRKENMVKLFKNIDLFNEKLEQNALFNILDKTKIAVKEIVKFADKKGCDLSEKEIAGIING